MMSVVMPMSGLARAQFLDDAEKFFARVAAVHQFQDAVAAALQRNVRALAEFRQTRVSLDQIITVTFRMRRGEADAFQSVNLVNGVEQLDEGGFASRQRWIAIVAFAVSS